MAPDRCDCAAPAATTERHRSARASRPMSDVERHKRAAAEAAAALVTDDMRVGLGTGSTVAHLLPALAARGLRGVRYVATSPATERAARALGLAVEELDAVGELDIAIDGADQIDPSGWLIKGGGAAQTREKIVAAAARRFVVIASAEKAVQMLRPLRAAWRSCVSAPTIRWRRSATRGCTRGAGEPRRQPDRRLLRSGRGPRQPVGAAEARPRAWSSTALFGPRSS